MKKSISFPHYLVLLLMSVLTLSACNKKEEDNTVQPAKIESKLEATIDGQKWVATKSSAGIVFKDGYYFIVIAGENTASPSTGTTEVSLEIPKARSIVGVFDTGPNYNENKSQIEYTMWNPGRTSGRVMDTYGFDSEPGVVTISAHDEKNKTVSGTFSGVLLGRLKSENKKITGSFDKVKYQ